MPRAAMRQANLFATIQDGQNLFVGTRVAVNFRVARHEPDSVRIPSCDSAECSSPHARNAQISKHDRIVLRRGRTRSAERVEAHLSDFSLCNLLSARCADNGRSMKGGRYVD